MITRKTTRIVTSALAAVLGAGIWAAVGQAAGPVLIAIGTISGFYEDFATQTAAPLENGVRGNRLGGMGRASRISAEISSSRCPIAGRTPSSSTRARTTRSPTSTAFIPCT